MQDTPKETKCKSIVIYFCSFIQAAAINCKDNHSPFSSTARIDVASNQKNMLSLDSVFRQFTHRACVVCQQPQALLHFAK